MLDESMLDLFTLEFILIADVDKAADICAIPCRFRFIRASTWLKHDLDVVSSVICWL